MRVEVGEVQIITRYQTRPNSNVGRYTATSLGRRVSRVNNFTGDQHLRVARLLAEEFGLDVGEMVNSTEDGQRRQFSTREAGPTQEEVDEAYAFADRILDRLPEDQRDRHTHPQDFP